LYKESQRESSFQSEVIDHRPWSAFVTFVPKPHTSSYIDPFFRRL